MLTNLEETGGLVEGLHCAVVDDQVARVRVGDDGLQCAGVHVAQVHVSLLALAQATHEHGSGNVQNKTTLKLIKTPKEHVKDEHINRNINISFKCQN